MMNKSLSYKTINSSLMDNRELFLKELYDLSGTDIINRILEIPEPRVFIHRLSCQDFFWLVKNIGENDSLALLELGSVDQWQYLLDLELWNRDRLDISQISHWLSLLQQANCGQLIKWLFKEGEYLAYYHFFRTIEVIVINKEDDIYDLPEGFFSLDGLIHIRVKDSQYRESIENIIRVMAAEDFQKYQSLFLGLTGVLPAEVEEELYRLKNVRLAEQGFLPFEEAIAIYAPLDPSAVHSEECQVLLDVLDDEEVRAMVPLLPLAQTRTPNLLMDVMSAIHDPILLDRLRLEFAGLANQVIVADMVMPNEPEALSNSCIKVARLVNLAIEKICGHNLSSAEDLLRRYPLITLFRVGFGMALKLKWEAERWLKKSWFQGQGLETGFWGEYRGGVLKGLLSKRPVFYIGSQDEDEYRDFEWLSDLNECLEVLGGLMALDGLLEKIMERHHMENVVNTPELTFYPLLFNFWARLLLKMERSFSGISLQQAKNLFSKLRGKNMERPYRMPGYQKRFTNDFLVYANNCHTEAASILENNLSVIWEEFCEEYKLVSISDLHEKYSKFIGIVQ